MSLINVVSSLPIRPRENPFIGFYSIPVLLDIIAKVADIPLVYSINQLGMIKVRKESLNSHLDDLQSLQINTTAVISDNELLAYIPQIFQRGLDEGWIIVQNKEIFRCSCGRTEGLYVEANLIQQQSRSVYDICDGQPQCRVCQQIAKTLFTNVYLLKIPPTALTDKIPPCMQEYAKKDLVTQIEFFRGKELLLSRTRVTEVQVIHQNETIYLDIDFLSMIYLFFLEQRGYYVEIIPIGYKMSKQLALALITAELLEVKLPQILIYLSYFSFSGGEEYLKKIQLSEFVKKYGYDVLRILLASGFGANKKEVSVPSSMIHQIRISLKNNSNNFGQSLLERETLESLWKQYSLEKMMRLIAGLRKPSIKRNAKDEYLLQKVL